MWFNDENENHVKTTQTSQCTWVRNRVSTFLSLANKDLYTSNKILYFQQIFIIFERVQISKVKFYKSLYIFMRNSLLEKSGSRIFKK